MTPSQMKKNSCINRFTCTKSNTHTSYSNNWDTKAYVYSRRKKQNYFLLIDFDAFTDDVLISNKLYSHSVSHHRLPVCTFKFTLRNSYTVNIVPTIGITFNNSGASPLYIPLNPSFCISTFICPTPDNRSTSGIWRF